MAVREVTITIRFSNDCLGSVRGPDCNRMMRNPSGRVMFLPTWWTAILKFAAEVRSKCHELVKRIEWDPLVVGSTRPFKRYYAPSRYTLHEAFLQGDSIQVNCVIPDALGLDDLKELMDVAGAYKGISPYKPDRKYGTFEVISIEPRTFVGAESGEEIVKEVSSPQ